MSMQDTSTHKPKVHCETKRYFRARTGTLSYMLASSDSRLATHDVHILLMMLALKKVVQLASMHACAVLRKNDDVWAGIEIRTVTL